MMKKRVVGVIVLLLLVFCGCKETNPGTEDMDADYRDYLFHAKGAAIGTGIGIIVAALSGVMILMVNGGVNN